MRREIARLSPEAKYKIIYSRVIELFCEDVRKNGIWMIDFLEDSNLVNDYQLACRSSRTCWAYALSVIVENFA